MFATGELGEMSEAGSGLTVKYSRLNLFNSYIYTGFESGIFYLPGKKISDDSVLELKQSVIIPVFANCGLKLPVTKKLYISPSLSMGGAYFNMKYGPEKGINIEQKSRQKNFIDPSLKSGLSIEYRFRQAYIGAGADYGVFIEQEGNIGFISGNLIFGYRY